MLYQQAIIHCGSTLLCSGSSKLFHSMVNFTILVYWSISSKNSFLLLAFHILIICPLLSIFHLKEKNSINTDSILFWCHSRLTQIWWLAPVHVFFVLENEAWRCFVWMFRRVKNAFCTCFNLLRVLHNFAYEVSKNCFM